MGQKLGAFLRVLGASLSPQAFAAQQNEFAAEQATERAKDVQIQTLDLKQGLVAAGALGAAYDNETDPTKKAEIVNNLKILSERVSGGDKRIANTLKNGWLEGRFKAKKDKSLFAKINPKDYTQESVKTFAKTRKFGDLVAIKKAPLVAIDSRGEDALSKAIGKAAGRQIVENQGLAKKAADSIKTSNETLKLLDEGVITGAGADFLLNAARVAKRLGFNQFDDDIKNTQAFAANQGKAVLNILGSGALGSGTGISDNDRNFAKDIAAGNISLDEKAIRRIIALNMKVNKNMINRHNKEFEKIRSKSPVDLSISIPESKAAPDMSDDEYEAKKRELGL